MDVSEEDKVDDDGLRKSEDQKSENLDNDSPSSKDGDCSLLDEIVKSVPGFRNRFVQGIDWPNRLRRCLLLAALACVLRPTNILIWVCIASYALFSSKTRGRMLPLPWEGVQAWVHVTSLSLSPATKKERMALLREVALCGY